MKPEVIPLKRKDAQGGRVEHPITETEGRTVVARGYAEREKCPVTTGHIPSVLQYERMMGMDGQTDGQLADWLCNSMDVSGINYLDTSKLYIMHF